MSMALPLSLCEERQAPVCRSICQPNLFLLSQIILPCVFCACCLTKGKKGCLVREELLFLPSSFQSCCVCCVWWLGVALAIDLSLYFPLFPKQKLLKQKLRWSSSPRTKSQLPITQGNGMAKNKNAKETNNRDTRLGSKLSHERRSPKSLRPEKRRVFVLSSILN